MRKAKADTTIDNTEVKVKAPRKRRTRKAKADNEAKRDRKAVDCYVHLDNDDNIPLPGQLIAQAEAKKSFMETHPDPRNTYKATFTCLGAQRTELVLASDIKSAEQQVKSQWSLVGVYLQDFVIEAV